MTLLSLPIGIIRTFAADWLDIYDLESLRLGTASKSLSELNAILKISVDGFKKCYVLNCENDSDLTMCTECDVIACSDHCSDCQFCGEGDDYGVVECDNCIESGKGEIRQCVGCEYLGCSDCVYDCRACEQPQCEDCSGECIAFGPGSNYEKYGPHNVECIECGAEWEYEDADDLHSCNKCGEVLCEDCTKDKTKYIYVASCTAHFCRSCHSEEMEEEAEGADADEEDDEEIE